MVPVSVRTEEERTDLGNRISLAFVDLPVHLSTPGRAAGGGAPGHVGVQALRAARGGRDDLRRLGMLPDPLRTGAARMVGSKRVYNLTVSNIPGPRFPLYVLGSELLEAYPVVPIAEDHALSIGMFSYRDHMHFGLYADPDALPDVRGLPDALNAAVLALSRTAGAAPVAAAEEPMEDGPQHPGGRGSRGSKRTESVTTHAAGPSGSTVRSCSQRRWLSIVERSWKARPGSIDSRWMSS